MNDTDKEMLKSVLAEVMQGYFKHNELGARIKSVSVRWVALPVHNSKDMQIYPEVIVEFLP